MRLDHLLSRETWLKSELVSARSTASQVEQTDSHLARYLTRYRPRYPVVRVFSVLTPHRVRPFCCLSGKELIDRKRSDNLLLTFGSTGDKVENLDTKRCSVSRVPERVLETAYRASGGGESNGTA